MRSGTSESKGIGKIAGARQIVSLIRGMSIDEIEESVRRPPMVLVVTGKPDAQELIHKVFGVREMPSIQAAPANDLPRDLDQFDLILVDNIASNSDFLAVRNRAGSAAYRTFDIGEQQDDAAIATLRDRIAEGLGDTTPALGRWYPGFREAAARAIINDTARTNAQFALLASIPTVVPVLGSVASAGADIIVLTKHQLTMAIKLAAIYGRPLNNKGDLFRDLIPVVGSGFIWRSLAREAFDFLPFAAGTIPKVAIAYAGTYTTGKGVETYYRIGKKPDKAQLTGWYQQALDVAKSRIPGLTRGSSAEEPAA